MKIQCDVCSAEEASVFCCADEAALCDACDGRVHRANKLAGKHRRFSLLKPSSSPATPLCDVCQERRGILFCQEDRAILCRDCDVPIHNANHHTVKHSRFLLTGVRLSSAPIPSSSEAEAEVVPNISNNNHHNQNCDSKINKDQKVVALEEEEVVCTTSSSTTTTTNTNNSSSISEYLIKMLPGWHVEDFLFDDATTNSAIHNGSFQGDELLPFMESSSTRSGLSAAAAKGLPIWVPTPGCLDHGLVSKEASHQNHRGGKASRQRWGEDFLMVPQFHHDFNSTKRPRTSL